ncbi:UNVERIFIED_CONTAM: hypothetical protein Slati_2618300 [Sesamum latifolium]|uniref:Uncharacterized protein n=1 Tax=Sesamum latifolium TaxID=2727402 RepID=A0AAW2VXC5_9LAMI
MGDQHRALELDVVEAAPRAGRPRSNPSSRHGAGCGRGSASSSPVAGPPASSRQCPELDGVKARGAGQVTRPQARGRGNI